MDAGAPAPGRIGILAVRESGVVQVQRLCGGLRIVPHPLESRPEDKSPPAVLAAVLLDVSGLTVLGLPMSLLDNVGPAAPFAALRNVPNWPHHRRIAFHAGRLRGVGRRIAPQQPDGADVLAVCHSVPVIQAAARPAAGGFLDGMLHRPGGLGPYPVPVLLDLPDLIVFNSGGCPESHPCGFLATQRSEGQKYPRQTDAAADKFLPYAAEEQ